MRIGRQTCKIIHASSCGEPRMALSLTWGVGGIPHGSNMGMPAQPGRTRFGASDMIWNGVKYSSRFLERGVNWQIHESFKRSSAVLTIVRGIEKSPTF